MPITPVRYGDNQPERPQVPVELRVEAHRILTAAERIAGHRERLRGEGAGYELVVERLTRVDTHLAWVLDQLDQVAVGLEEQGWVQPSS